jgi:hypothetical protein
MDLIETFRSERNVWLLSAAIFFFSAIPIFWSLQINGIPFRFLIWVVPLALLLLESVHRLHIEKDQAKS